MKTINLEYCHVTPDTNWDKEIEEANTHTPKLLEMYKDFSVQKFIMIDDLHVKEEVSQGFIDEVIAKLTVKPDCVYLESSFIPAAVKVISSINPDIATQFQSEEQTWLKKVQDQYNSTNDFLMSWKNNDGTIGFSCPTLVATSYLCRLGLLEAIITPFVGEEIKKADRLINLLSSKYLQVESNAQLIMRATHQDALEKITWHFY